MVAQMQDEANRLLAESEALTALATARIRETGQMVKGVFDELSVQCPACKRWEPWSEVDLHAATCDPIRAVVAR